MSRRQAFRIVRLRDQTAIATRCVEAGTPWARMRGLMGRRTMEAGEALLLPRCRSVHMWFMSMPIDIAFLDEGWVVTRVLSNVRPWNLWPLTDLRAKHTLELPAGVINKTGLRVGDRLCTA